MERVKLYEIVEREVVTLDPHRLTFRETGVLGELTESVARVQDEDTLVRPVSKTYTIPVDRIVSRVVNSEGNAHYHDQLVAVHPDVLNVITVVQQGRISSLQAAVTRAEQNNLHLHQKLGKYTEEIRENFASLPLLKRILLAFSPTKYNHLLK